MEASVLFAIATVAAALVVLPGPDWALVLAAGMGTPGGRLAPTVTGLALGYVVLTFLVVVGIAPVVAAAPAALVVLTAAGAGYLIYLGVGIIRDTRVDEPPAAAVSPTSARGALIRGLGVSVLNPKSLLFFLAFLPQFARASAPWPLALQFLMLGGIWVALVAVIYTILGCSAGRALAGRPRLARGVTLTAGIAMVLAGPGLLIEQVVHHLTP